jgi:hypothetical protein
VTRSVMMFICKMPICEYVTMFDSHEYLGGFTLEPDVHQLVMTTITLPDSTMMMQFHCHHWALKNLLQGKPLLATPTIRCQAGQHIVKLQLCRIMCAADVNAICK